MKTTPHPFRWIAICSLGLLLAGCGDKADSTKAPAGSGRLFGVSFQTMNNPFFVDLNVGLQKTIEAQGDRLTTLDAQFNSLKQKNDISDLSRGACTVSRSQTGAPAEGNARQKRLSKYRLFSPARRV